MTKHTPGPWDLGGHVNARYLNGIGDVTLVRRVTSDDNRYIALVSIDGMGHGSMARTTPEEREANALLIAAAPDLLAAAQTVLADLNARIDAAPSTAKPVFRGIAELHDAIAKALPTPSPQESDNAV